MKTLIHILNFVRSLLDPSYEYKNPYIDMKEWKVIDGYKLSRIIENVPKKK